MNRNNSYFETSSLPLAASIICSGILLDSIVKNQDGKAVFIFNRSNNPDLDRIIQDFWKKELRTEPNAFWEAVRFLKSRIYGEFQ